MVGMERQTVKNRERTIIRTSLVGIGGNAGLVAIKLVVGIIANSLALILDAVNNLTDALSSILTLVGTKLAAKLPTKKHPYGYGQVEYLTSLIIGLIIGAAGVMSIVQSVRGVVEDPKGTILPDFTVISFVLIAIGIVVKVGIGLYFRHQGKRTNSKALLGSGTDALFDALLSFSTLVSAIVARYAGVSIENYLGIVIGLFILRAGIQVLAEAFSLIIGERVPKEESDALKKLIVEHKEVRGVYDLIIHHYGPNRAMASAHIELDDTVTAKEIDRLTRHITEDAYRDLGIILTLGIYAANDTSEIIVAIRRKLMELIGQEEGILQVHGLYLREEEHLVTYDLLFDFSIGGAEETKKKIEEAMHEAFPDYQFVSIIDRAFTDL